MTTETFPNIPGAFTTVEKPPYSAHELHVAISGTDAALCGARIAKHASVGTFPGARGRCEECTIRARRWSARETLRKLHQGRVWGQHEHHIL